MYIYLLQTVNIDICCNCVNKKVGIVKKSIMISFVDCVKV